MYVFTTVEFGGERGRKERKVGERREEVSREVICYLSLTELVRDLVEHEGDHGADAQSQALRYGCPQSQSICKVVHAISHNDEPGQGLDPQPKPFLWRRSGLLYEIVTNMYIVSNKSSTCY